MFNYTPYSSPLLNALQEEIEWVVPDTVPAMSMAVREFVAEHSGSSSAQIRSYARLCENAVFLMETFPNKRNNSRLVKVAKQVSNLKGTSARVMERLISVIKGTAFYESLLEGVCDHSSFIQKLEREFHLDVDHWVPIREGVQVFLDAENTETLSNALADGNDYFTELIDGMGYILLRRGRIDVWEDFSCWLFVYAPPDNVDKPAKAKDTTIKTLKTVELE